MRVSDYEPLKVYIGGDPDQFRRQSQADMLWRPTVVILVRRGGKYLVTNHQVRRKAEDGTLHWKIKPDLPKGGVDLCDLQVFDAALRELWEEVCLTLTDLHLIDYFGHVRVPFDRYNLGRDGYKEGKWYLIYHATASGNAQAQPGLEHGVIEVLWKADPAEHFKKLEGKQTKKYRIFSSPEFDTMFGRRAAA